MEWYILDTCLDVFSAEHLSLTEFSMTNILILAKHMCSFVEEKSKNSYQ